MAGDVDTSAPAEKDENKQDAGEGNTTGAGASSSTNNNDGTDNTNKPATGATTSTETADLLRADGLGTCSDSGNDWVTDFLGNWCGTPPQSTESTTAKPATNTPADTSAANQKLTNQGFPAFSVSDYSKDWGDEFAYDYTLYSNDALWTTADASTYNFGQNLQMETGAVGNDATGGNLTRVSYEAGQEVSATTDNTNKPPEQQEGKNWFSRTFDRFFNLFGSGEGGDAATKTTADGGKGEFRREGDTVTGETTNAKGDKANYEFGPNGMRRRDDHGTFERGPDGRMTYKPHSGKSEWVSEDGVWKVKGENGESFWQDKDGVSHIQKGDKTWTKGKDGVLRDNAGLEVHDDRLEMAVQTAERMYTVVMARKRLEEGVTAVDHALRRHEATQPGGTVQGREAQQRRDQIETVTDADGRTSTIRQTKDGRLTVVTNEDGTTDLIMKGRSGKSMTFHINKEGTEAVVTTPDGKKASMERGPDGQWHRCHHNDDEGDDDDNEAAEAVNGLTTSPAGQLQIGTLQIQIAGDGRVQVADARTGTVQARVDEEKTTTDGGAVTTNKDNTTTIANGPGGEPVATVTGRQGEATVTAGDQTSTVNQNEGSYKVEEGGEVVVQSGDKPGEDKFAGFEDYTFGPDGTITDSSGTKVENGILVTPHGEVDPETGRQKWDDNFEVDEQGNMYYDGEYFGAVAGSEAAAYWENSSSGDTNYGDGAIAAASSALSAADAAIQRVMADIGAGRKPDPGAIAAAYGALSSVKTSLLMAAGMGDLDALDKIGAVNSALGELDGSRGKADSQLSTLQAAEYAINDLRNNGISVQLTQSLAAQLYEMGGPRGENLKQLLSHGDEGDQPRAATR